MRGFAAPGMVLLALSTAAASDAPPAFEHLVVQGQSVQVLNGTRLRVSAGPGFRLIGPHNFTKEEENGYHFEVSLASFVATKQVISVAAERLVEESALNYDELKAAKWPDAGFLSRASGCAALTPEQAAGMPAESGMKWIREAGFVPSGSFAFEAALLLSEDRRHEASIELIAPVASCDDAREIETSLNSLRALVRVVRSGAKQ